MDGVGVAVQGLLFLNLLYKWIELPIPILSLNAAHDDIGTQKQI